MLSVFHVLIDLRSLLLRGLDLVEGETPPFTKQGIIALLSSTRVHGSIS